MLKILAVEDNPAILGFYVEFFTDAGFEVRTAEDALSAITMHQQFRPDLIVLDLNIPAGGGMMVFETLRTRLQDPVPVIFSTGKPEQLPDMSRLHNVAIINKTASPDALMAEVKRMLAGKLERPLNPNPPPPPAQRPAVRRKVLLVDDDPLVLELYTEILSKAGFDTATAEDAIGAVTRFQECKPDLVVLDVDMPAGGGVKVFERLRIQLAAPTPILFSTASPASVASLEKSLNVLVLKKPLTPHVLIGAVKDLLKME
jgi:DNA-binding response OmpR family regulator